MNKPQTDAIQGWAKGNGISLTQYGDIHPSVIEGYNRIHSGELVDRSAIMRVISIMVGISPPHGFKGTWRCPYCGDVIKCALQLELEDHYKECDYYEPVTEGDDEPKQRSDAVVFNRGPLLSPWDH